MQVMRDEQASARRAPWKVPVGRLLPLALTALLGAGLAAAVLAALLSFERSRLQSDFTAMAGDRAQAIRAGLAEDYIELELIASYVTAANELAGGKLGPFAAEFGRFAGRLPSLEPDTVMVGYAMRVGPGARPGFESHGRADLDPDFRLLERSPAGELVPASDRAEYFPLTVVEPPAMGAGIVGFDLATVPALREGIDRAIATGKLATGGVTDLPLAGSGKSILWQFVPVYRHEAAPGIEPPRGDLLGVVTAAFRIDEMVEAALAEVSVTGIDLDIRDTAAAPDTQRLYYHRSRGPGPGVPAVPKGWMTWTTNVDVGGRSWALIAYPTPSFLSRHRSPLPWIVLGAGLLLSAAATAFLAGRLRRAERIESLVQERTRELAREIDKHQRLEGALADSRATLAAQIDRLNERSQEILLLNEMGDTLQACIVTAEAFPVISLYLPRILPGTSGALYMHDPASDLFVGAAEWGEARPPVAAFKAEDCWALRRGRMHAVDDSAPALPCAHAAAQAGTSSLCIPLAAIGKTLGLFHILGCEEGARGLAASVADRVGLALSNLMLRSDLRQLSIHDPLTGLFNRRYMEEALEIETHRADRKGTSIGVIMLDIDHFKAFNDGFGHAAGDDLLRALAGLMQGRLRAGDIACRYGGEEFVLILPEAGVEASAARAEDVRQRVKTLDVKSGETKLGPITISAGVAVFPADAPSRDELLRVADACLYQAKEAGRDRVVVAEAARRREEAPSSLPGP